MPTDLSNEIERDNSYPPITKELIRRNLRIGVWAAHEFHDPSCHCTLCMTCPTCFEYGFDCTCPADPIDLDDLPGIQGYYPY